MRKLLIALVVLVALLVAADRIAVVLAEHEVAQQLASDEPDCAKPSVHIAGFPFLTQAIRGRYSNVSIGTSCTASSSVSSALAVHFDPVDVDLHNVHVPLSEIVHQSVTRVPVDTATGSLTLPYSELSHGAAGQSLRVSRGPDNTIVITGTLTVAGHSVTARGTGRLSYTGGELHASVGTVSTPAGSVDASSAFDISVPIPSLPFRLTQAHVEAGPTGVVFSATSHDLVLSH